MKKFNYIPALITSAILVFASGAVHAQNPPMNCAPDGIIEVCTPTAAASQPEAAPLIPATPKVSYKNGLLTIVAENIPLSQVLHEVSRKTGATLEVPEASATEPVFANLGPASVRDVLVKLLNGTKFNYVMLGSPDTSSDLKKIVLTPSGQNTEVAESSVPNIGLATTHTSAVPAAAPPQSEEERRNAFMADVESKRAEVMQRMQEKYADMASKGLLRTPEPRGADAAAGTAPQAGPAEAAEPESPIADAPTP